MRLALLPLALLLPLASAAAETAFVHAPAVDLHLQPDDASPRLGTLLRGDSVRVRRFLGDSWAEIEPPDSAWGWVDAGAIRRTPGATQLVVMSDFVPLRTAIGREGRNLGPITQIVRQGERLALVEKRPLVDRSVSPPISYLPVALDPRFPWYVRRDSLDRSPPRNPPPRNALTSGWPDAPQDVCDAGTSPSPANTSRDQPPIMLSIAPAPARAELANRIFADTIPDSTPSRLTRRAPDAAGTLLSSSRMVEGERAWVLIDSAGQVAALVLVPTGFDPKRWNGRKVELFGEVHFSETHHTRVIRVRQIEPAPQRR